MVQYTISGFALVFIFLSPPFLPIRFFVPFSCLEPNFWSFFAKKKEPGFWPFFTKSLLSLTPLILVDYSIHIDTITMDNGIVHFVFKAANSL